MPDFEDLEVIGADKMIKRSSLHKKATEGQNMGATMAWTVLYPPSSIPAYIEQSMKLFVCLSVKIHFFNYCYIRFGYMEAHQFWGRL